MNLKLDKDAVLKNKFWILLVVAVPMIIAGQYILMGPVAADVAKKKKAVEAELKKYRDIKPPYYNETNIAEKQKQQKEVQAREKSLWQQLYSKQEPTLFWPTRFEAKFPMNTGKFIRELKFPEPGSTPTPNDQHHFSGKIIDRDDISIVVQGKDGKKERFYEVGAREMKIGKGRSFYEVPKDVDVEVVYQTGRYFNDLLSQTEQSLYHRNYASQIRPILDIVEPVNDEGEGVVVLKEWLVPKKMPNELPPNNAPFLKFVKASWTAEADISEEAWLAQEDLWIQKEIYRLVRQANDYVGKMQGNAVKDLNSIATFKNVYFELNLKLLSADKLWVTIKNLQNHRQRLEVRFRVTFTDSKGGENVETILIEGEPLEPAGSIDTAKGKAKDSITQTIDLPTGPSRKGIANVEQALTWENAAVRRIDLIGIGSVDPADLSLSHRSFPDGVKPLIPEKKVETTAEGEQPKAGGFVPPSGPQSALAKQPLLVNGLIKNRYIEPPTEQTRRLPVVVVLIADQDHVDRVLTSFANSSYRFVLNQMLINRYPLSVRPNVSQENLGAGGIPIPGRTPLPKGFPPGQGAPTGEEETEANVELVLYGTVTLYNRFPPRDLPKTAEEPKQ